jgi:hypothetical protein
MIVSKKQLRLYQLHDYKTYNNALAQNKAKVDLDADTKQNQNIKHMQLCYKNKNTGLSKHQITITKNIQ